MAACAASGARAVHPGYGFLSESAAFARACDDAGLVFVGPPAAAIELLGDKRAAKQLAGQIGVPCLAGYGGSDQSPAALAREAARLGAPLMIKAAAGGGGRGMRRVDDLADFDAARAAATSEAQAAFGSGALLLERLVHHARHVEVQVLADRFGHCIHLGERDCSTQRRHQKIVEEAPAPDVTPALRAALGDAAVKLALAAGYVGAGTVEFLLDPDGRFHFLEVNTRLQVEHPVTEAITGLDLVELQLRVARGERLSLRQDDVRWRGHAIEARLCAEDAFDGFRPQAGPILAWRLPGDTPGLRVDHGLAPRAQVPRHYDSMIAKLIATGHDRDEARRRLIGALGQTSILGLATNRDFLIACLRAPDFAEARLATSWLDAAATGWQAPRPDSRWQAAATALWARSHARVHGALAGWSSTGPRTTFAALASGEARWQARVVPEAHGYRVTIDGREHRVSIVADDRIEIDGQCLPVHVRWRADAGAAHAGWLDLGGACAGFSDVSALPPRRAAGNASGDVRATMHGQVAALSVAAGDRVRAGQPLLAIEAMKMQHRVDAPI
ncbi:MAG: biotin carboxylase N-terminal domain-containing protein, partial [Alphaproteobacteria bacterium]